MIDQQRYIIEACVDSVESAMVAWQGGADRIELCDNLSAGGTTPSLATLRVLKRIIGIPVFVLIRPRSGDFLYSSTEFDVMKEDVKIAVSEGADGIVTGVLKKDGRVDVDRCSELVSLAGKLDATFHRAIDLSADPLSALQHIESCGFRRVLTSGSKNSAEEGVNVIREMVQNGGDLIVMPGGGIHEKNIRVLARETGATEFHMSLRKRRSSQMEFRREGVHMGKGPEEEYEFFVADAERFARVRNILDKLVL